MDGKLKGHAALWVANIIWGLNAPIGKSVLWSETHPQGVSPFALSVYRMLGACLLFWTVSLFLPREKVAPRDIVLLPPVGSGIALSAAALGPRDLLSCASLAASSV